MKINWLILLFCFPALCISQPYEAHDFRIKKEATIHIDQLGDDWRPHLQFLVMPHPGGDAYQDILEQQKSDIQQNSLRSSQGEIKDFPAKPPILEKNFAGNPFTGPAPNDNDLAISNGDKLVSVINTSIYVYDAVQDTELAHFSLSNFADTLGLPHHKYDPKVLYDPSDDRFIIVYLNGSLDSTSRIVIAFSQSADPTLSWNLYALPGNPLDNDTWSDYPVVGISEDELFIGINTFYNGSTNNSGFVESNFWQIDKSKGYSGDSLDTRYYSGLAVNGKSLFNITPIQGGSALYGPEMYLLSNRNLDKENDSIFLLKVSGRINSSPTLDIDILRSSTTYALPPEARQRIFYIGQDTFMHIFDTNDSRILGGFLENGRIQFVGSTLVPSTGRAGIYHGFIEDPDGTPKVTGNILGDSVIDFGFPNISYSGTHAGNHDAIITFNHTAPEEPSGFSMMFYGGDGTYSPFQFIKQGTMFVNRIPGLDERWGDYTGSQRKYNEDGVVWTSGSFGQYSSLTQKGANYTWIAEIRRVEIEEPDTTSNPGLNTFPNPFGDMVYLEFTVTQPTIVNIRVTDLQGKTVKMLMRSRIKAGINEFSFSMAPLSAGIYILTIEDGNDVIARKKIVKQ